jgi:hypothetical protein
MLVSFMPLERQDLIEDSLIEAIIIAIVEIIVRAAETSVVLYQEVMLVDIVQVEEVARGLLGTDRRSALPIAVLGSMLTFNPSCGPWIKMGIVIPLP